MTGVKADCPHFVGARETAAELIVGIVRNGIRHVILDIPRAERDFAEIHEACVLAGELLNSASPANR